MSYYNGPKIVTDGLVMVLDPSNEKSHTSGSTVVYDLSGNNNSGSLKNGPVFTTSGSGGLIYDGIDDYVLTPLNIDSNPYSVFAWCYPYTTAGDRGVFLTDNGNWDKGLEISAGSWAVHNGNALAGTGVAASANTWYNCCLVYATDNIYLYVNGNRVWTSGYASTGAAGSTIEIGRANYNAGAGSRFFNGIISSVVAYNRVITDKEALQNYEATKARFGL